MALPVLAAGAARVASVSGRAGVSGASRSAAAAGRGARSAAQMKSRLLAGRRQMRQPQQPSTTDSQQAVKQAAKKAIPKAAVFIVNSIAGAFELGTAGIAILVTFLIRFITIGWYNIEMIFGGWIMKGKHPIIGPLTWDPLPIPLPKPPEGQNSLTLTALVLISDFLVVMTILVTVALIGGLFMLMTSFFSF